MVEYQMMKFPWAFKKLMLTITILSLFLSSACNDASRPKTLADLFAKLEIHLDEAEKFVVNEDVLREGRDNTFWTILAQHDETYIKLEIIKNVDDKTARQLVEERKYAILSLYEHIPSAYPGMITNTVESPDEFKPVIMPLNIQGMSIPVYLLYSTSRFTYGATTKDLIKYRGALIFINRPDSRILLRMDVFIPKNTFNKEEVLKWLGTLQISDRLAPDSKTKSEIASVGVPETKQPDGSSNRRIRLGQSGDFNLIIIAFEPLGANHVGIYGYTKDTTPNLDRFSKGAFVFKNAISPSSWTLPVFMSWFTGLYPSQHRIVNKYHIYKADKQVYSNLAELTPSAVTLAQVLKTHGYKTAGFTGGAALSRSFGYNLGFDTYYDDATFGGFDISFEMALSWLEQNKSQKFFLFVQGFDVHGRYPLPDSNRNPFIEFDYKGKYSGSIDEYWKLRNLSIDQRPLNMSAADVNFWNAVYDAKISEADKRFGKFIDAIQKLELMDQTIILISSGSGNEYYEHQRFDHGFSLYDELLRVPLILKIPGSKGGMIADQVRTLDIMPTALDILAIPLDEKIKTQMQGTSLLSLMNGETKKLYAFSETDYLLQAFLRSVRSPEGYKYIYALDTENRELYNLLVDPREQTNLISKEKRIAYELEQKLFRHLKSLRQNALQP
jgi:arylsulfatase A-like enzyme